MATLALITEGDPDSLSGGYLYHRRLAELAPRSGMEILFFSLPAWPFPLPLLRARPVLARALRLPPTALLVDSIVAGTLWPALLARSRRPPLIAVLHQPPGGIDHGPLRTRLQARLDLLTYQRTDAFIAASQHLATELLAYGVPKDRLAIVPPGRGEKAGATRANRRLSASLRSGRHLALLCVANWLERKGVHYLLEALARLPDELATLHLVGETYQASAYGRRLCTRINQPDLRDRVVVHGPLPRTRLDAIYAAADAFALPSLREPYGTVYGEALAAGLPIVGFEAGNLPNLVQDGRQGLLVPRGNVDALAGAITRLAANGTLRQRMARAARAAGARLPTWEQSAALFFSAVRSVL